MQENYISLNPANLQSEEKYVRKQVYAQRLLEAQGGKASILVGTQWGLTASVLAYSTLPAAFTMFPFAASKSMGYATVIGSFLGAYMVGHSFVMGNFGDSRQYNYMLVNRYGILKGSKAWDRD